MRRRNFIVGTTALYFSRLSPASAQQPDTVLLNELPPLPPDLAGFSSNPPAPYTETALVGTAAPTATEMRVAYELLHQAPIQTTPVDVAHYFLSIGAGAYGQELRPYAREWPVRANPLIYHFFSSTLTKPEGDATAWCAAFLNWCLLRARATTSDEIGRAPGSFSVAGKAFASNNIVNHSTSSASSGSFRCWAEASTPRRGDIAVFKNQGTEGETRLCRGQGHVAFYLSTPKPGWARVLGGNQIDPGSNGAVTVADMSTDPKGRFMKFVGIK